MLPFILAACQLLGEERAPATLVVGTAAPPALLHPMVEGQPWSDGSLLVFSRLYAVDLQGSLVTDLVESDAVSSDGRTWTLNLKPNVQWHDGVRFSANDVIFTLVRLFDPDSPTELAQKLAPVVDFAAASPSVVTLQLAAPWPDLRQALVELPIIAAHRAARERSGDPPAAPVGTGPFRVVRATTNELYLERFEGYHGPHPAARTLILRSVPDDDERAREVRDGMLDLATIKPQCARMLEDRGDLRLYRLQSGRTLLASLNLNRPPMDDARVRRAISQLIDRIDLVNDAFDGAGAPLLTPIPPGCTCRVTAADGGGDADDAHQLLAAAGFTREGEHLVREGKPLKLDILVPRSNALLRRASEVLARQLEHQGIATARFLLSDADYEAARREPLDNYDALLQSFESHHSAANFLRFYLHSSGKGNLMGFHCTEIDQLIDQLSGCQNGSAQDHLCEQLQAVLKIEMPLLALAAPHTLLVTRASLKGVTGNELLSGDLGQVIESLVPSRTAASAAGHP